MVTNPSGPKFWYGYSGDGGEPVKWSFTIFEGTSEIQSLVISRAIGGVHVQ